MHLQVEKWDEILGLNLSACFHTTRLFLPDMKRQKWGRIINVASVHGLVASINKSAYVAAKHGLIGFTKVIPTRVPSLLFTSHRAPGRCPRNGWPWRHLQRHLSRLGLDWADREPAPSADEGERHLLRGSEESNATGETTLYGVRDAFTGRPGTQGRCEVDSRPDWRDGRLPGLGSGEPNHGNCVAGGRGVDQPVKERNRLSRGCTSQFRIQHGKDKQTHQILARNTSGRQVQPRNVLMTVASSG